MDFSSGKEKLENFTQRIADLNKISNSPFYFRFQYVKNLVKEDKSSFPPSPRPALRGRGSVAEDLENIKDTLDIWLNYFRSILLSRFLPASPSLQPKDENFDKYSTIKIKNIINHIQTTKFLLSSTNINTKLALERLILEM